MLIVNTHKHVYKAMYALFVDKSINEPGRMFIVHHTVTLPYCSSINTVASATATPAAGYCRCMDILNETSNLTARIKRTYIKEGNYIYRHLTLQLCMPVIVTLTSGTHACMHSRTRTHTHTLTHMHTYT